ncbi:4,5-DOPA dioxygenase extradiol [Aestuariimicrobium sp. T2.26MG-19.2B]|nr:4,5-DOPA dioxygenase extradiol [Aestuariimicrobium sp. T2.26MG-19.2B]
MAKIGNPGNIDPLTCVTSCVKQMSSVERQPVLYLSHGAPPLADDQTWTRQLADWSGALQTAAGKPSAILMVSAHWEQAPLTVSSTVQGTPLVYDFWGFPERYYQVTYDAPVAPGLATDISKLIGGETPLYTDPERGLDHGAYVPLVEMFPEADVPVLQLSMPTLAPEKLYDLGRRLAPLREQGVLIVGSGFTTHNLRGFNPNAPADAPAPTWSTEFDAWAAERMDAHDVDALLNYEQQAPAATIAHPRSEHWAPLYISLGAAMESNPSPKVTSTVDGFWFGLSKRSWQLD